MIDLQRTPDGRRLCIGREVDAPVGVAWDVLRDTETWPEWGPSVRAVDSAERYVREGTTGRVRTPLGWLGFEVTTCRDRRWTWRVAGVPATGHRAEPAGDGSRVVFEVPPVAAAYAPVCRRACRRIAAAARRRAGADGEG